MYIIQSTLLWRVISRNKVIQLLVLPASLVNSQCESCACENGPPTRLARPNGNCGTSALGSALCAHAPIVIAHKLATSHQSNTLSPRPLYLPCYEHYQSHQLSHSAPSSLFNAMISSGFTNAPVTQFLVFGTVIGALLATITDSRYYLHIQVVPHIWQYGQFWRFAVWQVCERWKKCMRRRRTGQTLTCYPIVELHKFD